MTETAPDDDIDSRDGLADRLLLRTDRSVRAVRAVLKKNMPEPVQDGWNWLGGTISRALPKGLLGRSLLIIVAPMLLLLSVLTGVFMDRHWAVVTARLSDAVVRDIAALVDLIEDQPPAADPSRVLAIAGKRLGLRAEILPAGTPLPKNGSSLGLLDNTLSAALEQQVGREFSLDEEAEKTIEVRVPIDRGVLRVVFPRNLAYAANWHFFLVWMAGVGLFVIASSMLFIRNQIRPIQRLANAAEAFGKGRAVPNFAPQGAREVRKAAHAFIEMRRRIERQIEQRTTMLAGVSHDLRTVLTRFRLELAMMEPGEERQAMTRDIDEMEAMLEAYLAFAKGHPDEAAEVVDVAAIVREIAERAGGSAGPVTMTVAGDPLAMVRPGAFRRLVGNLLGNALRYGNRVAVAVDHREGWLSVTVDDDGPGIPDDEREAVFRPFYRLDEARNQDEGGTGLGLAIARDIARGHGGEIFLEDSPMGGLRAVVRLPG